MVKNFKSAVLSLTEYNVESFLSVGVEVHGQQNVVGSLGRNFVGNLFVAKQCKTSHAFVIRLWGRNFVVKDDQRNP